MNGTKGSSSSSGRGELLGLQQGERPDYTVTIDENHGTIRLSTFYQEPYKDCSLLPALEANAAMSLVSRVLEQGALWTERGVSKSGS